MSATRRAGKIALAGMMLLLCGCSSAPYRTHGTPLPYYTLKP